MAIKIYIDQGHNPEGINAGAEGFGIREQDITYQVGHFLFDILSVFTSDFIEVLADLVVFVLANLGF